MTTQDDRMAAIGATAASLLRHTPYHLVRAQDVAAAVRLPGRVGRSAVWLYNETRSRRVLVALAAAHAWGEYLGQGGLSRAAPVDSATEARERATAALRAVVRFHRAERQLMTQVGLGIGDISTTEKRQPPHGSEADPPQWPDTRLGRVANSAWHGRCTVFSDFLGPVLRECANAVTWMPDEVVMAAADRLSDISFHACLVDGDGPTELVARGLAALWFERDLGQAADGLARDLESCETAAAVASRRGTDVRAEVQASSAVVRVLLEAGTLYERCAREASRNVTLWRRVADPIRQDTERLCDAVSHQGLAAFRFGDLEGARRAWQASRAIADQGLSGDVSRIARVDGNLAELAAQTGQHGDAWTAIEAVCDVRESALRKHPGEAAAWRRMTVSARARADIARVTGRVTDAVRLSERLLADRAERLPEARNPDVAEAMLTLGKALLSAGSPETAHRYLEGAAQQRSALYLHSSHRVQEDTVWLAKVALASGQYSSALDALDGQPVLTDWFADRVSFRLSYTARRLAATAQASLGDAVGAEAELRANLTGLERFPILAGLDPLAADFRRSLGEAALLRRAFADAVAILGGLANDEVAAGQPNPARGWTLVLLARAADGLGDRLRARECYESVTKLVRVNVDPAHPVVLTAHLDEATRRARESDARGAAELLLPMLEDQLLPRSNYVLDADHAILASARALAERLGVTPRSPASLAGSSPPPLDTEL